MSRGHWNNGKLDHQQAVRPLSSNPGPLLLRQRAPWPPVQRMAGPRSGTAVPLVSPGVYRPAPPAKSGLGQRKYNSCRRRSKNLSSLLSLCAAIVSLLEAPPGLPPPRPWFLEWSVQKLWRFPVAEFIDPVREFKPALKWVSRGVWLILPFNPTIQLALTPVYDLWIRLQYVLHTFTTVPYVLNEFGR
jgi:hypothetical protein